MSEKLVGNIHMSSHRFGHDCTFTWRLRNLSFLKSKTKKIAKHDFSLHPKCDTTWSIVIYGVVGGYEVRVGTQTTKMPKMAPSFHIGLLDREGKLVLPQEPEEADKGENVCIVMKIRSGEGNSLIIGDGVVVELEDDTLVVNGRVVVPTCCTRTEIDKEETTAVPKTTKLLDFCELIKDGFVVA